MINSDKCKPFLEAEAKGLDVLDDKHPCKFCEKFNECDNGDGVCQ